MASFSESYLDLISSRSAGNWAGLLRAGLRLLSFGYRAIMAARNAYYNHFPGASFRPPCPVIAIGNITVGGTGKTPCTVRVANLLIQQQLRPALLLRGYKGAAIQFDEDQREEALHRWRMESDEALVLKRRCPRAMVLVNPNRVASAKQALVKSIDVIVLDDGFQHRRLARDLDIVLVDATSPFGFGHLLPRGLLREPMSALRRADLLIVTRSDQVDDTTRKVLIGRLERLSGNKPIITARHRLTGFTDVKGRNEPATDPAAMQAVVFAGIANFASFRKSLEGLGVHVLAAYQYPDHHDYRPDEIAALADVAVTLEANVLLTTEKDAVKLAGRWPDKGCRLLVVRMDLEFEGDGERRLTEILERTCVTRKDG